MGSSKRSSRRSARRNPQGGSRRGRRPAAPEPASRTGGWRAPLLVAAGLVALTVAIFHPVASHEFLRLDDSAYYTENPHLDGRFGPADVRDAFSRSYFANWIPLTSLSIALGDALHGPDPGAVLVTNAALHALAGVLLFLALLRMTNQLAASAFVAGAFVAHPLHVEPVAWASQRKDVLMGVFWMASLWAHARYVERQTPLRYVLVAACVALALLSKPAAVTLPFALLLLDFWPLRRFGPGGERAELRRAVLEKLPLLALVAVVSAVTLVVQFGVGATQAIQVPFWHRLANAVVGYAAYLVDALWPSGLAAYYPYPLDGLDAGVVTLSALLIASLSAISIALARSRPALCVGWLWFLGTLVPTIGLIQVGTQARADRYMYVPLIGLTLALAFGAVAPSRRLGRAGALAAGAAVALLALLSWVQVGHWRDTRTLFTHALKVTRDNYVAHQMVGMADRKAGDLEQAERHLRDAKRIQPGSPSVPVDLAAVLIDQGRTGEAREELERARAAGVDSADLYAVLGLAAEREEREADAVASYRLALARDPDHREAGNNLAWILATTRIPALRDPDAAVRLAERVAQRSAGNGLVLDTLAAAYAAAGRWEEAIRTQVRAIEALPADAEVALLDAFGERLQRYRVRRTALGAGSGS